MAIKAVLFDLDGTLLPMDQDEFVKTYFGLLAQKLAVHGYEPKQLVDAVWAGTAAMVKNTGEATNETVFWNTFAGIYGEQSRKDLPLFDEFYKNEFEGARSASWHSPHAAIAVERARELGFRVALATTPIFPRDAVLSRLRWAGLDAASFELITSYETAMHSKPSPAYYLDVAHALGLEPLNCLMVGNDVGDDMVAAKVGMQVFLLTDCLINKAGKDISAYPNGGFGELMAHLAALAAK